MTNNTPDQISPPAPSADLAQLVTTEQELEQKLVQAREQARLAIEAAYTAAGVRSKEQAEQLSGARQRFETEVEEERHRAAAQVLVEGEQEVARFDAIPDSQVGVLADVVVARLLGGRGG